MASTLRILARNWLPRPFALRRPAHQARDVDQLQDGGDDLLRFDVLIDRGEPAVGDRDGADVGLDRAKGVVLAGNARRGERVKQRAFADIR